MLHEAQGRAQGHVASASTTHRRDSYSYSPPPLSALPPTLREYVAEVSGSFGCDPAYVLLPALAMLFQAVGNTRLVRVKDDLYYTPGTLAHIETTLRGYLKEHEKITVVDFKDLVGLTRKHAVDLLEHFDAAKVTIRLDNERVLRQSPV